MSEGMSVLVGMSIAYAASFIGMIVALVSYRKRRRDSAPNAKEDRRA